MSTIETYSNDERTDLVESLNAHRHFLRFTVRDLDGEQAGRRSTVSELCLGGLIKHVTSVERMWVDFIVHGPSVMSDREQWTAGHRAREFSMLESDSLADILADYERVAKRTDELVATLPDLDVAQPLPETPWFEPGTRWTARRVLLHIITETAQHAGHADIIRESIDGAKTMA